MLLTFSKLCLGRDGAGSRDSEDASLDELKRLLKETFPIGDFPVALYVSVQGALLLSLA